jgi:excisionase family DNA binding protein
MRGVEERKNTSGLATLAPLAVRVERAAEMIGVSRAHIFRLIAAGELRTIKSGSRRLVPVEAISEYLARSGG